MFYPFSVAPSAHVDSAEMVSGLSAREHLRDILSRPSDFGHY